MSALNVIYEVTNIPRSILTHNQDTSVDEIVKIATAARARVCLHCGTSVADCVLAVIAGQAACCPDCTTLTIPARNAIREAIAAHVAARVGEERERCAAVVENYLKARRGTVIISHDNASLASMLRTTPEAR